MHQNHFGVESLESRRLLSLTALSLSYALVAGHQWTTSRSDGATDTITVLGKSSSNGNDFWQVRDQGSHGSISTNEIIDLALDGNNGFVNYGGTLTETDSSTDPPTTFTSVDTFSPYLLYIPAVMVAGKTYTSTCTLTGVSGGKSASLTEVQSIKLVSNTTTRITVPAGAFSCYQVVDTETDTNAKGNVTTSTSVRWLSPGNHPIETINGTGSDQTTTVLTGGFIVKQTPTQVAFATQPSDSNTGVAMSPAVTVDVEDSGGTPVADATSTVSLSIASGPAGGTLSGTASVAAVGGEATFSDLKFSKPGTYTLKAADGSLTTAVSGKFDIIGSSGPAQLSFGVQPTSTSTGKVIFPAVTVDVDDSDGILVNTDTSIVKLAIASGPTGGKLAGTVSVSAVDGTAAFTNLTLSTPGVYTLKATDGSLTAATSATFTILAIPAKLAFAVSPGAVIAGKIIAPSVTVDVETAAGAIVTTDASTVAVSVGSGPGSLGGTLTAKAVKGVATFSSLLLTKVGSYKLKAVDGSLTAATSSAFTVSAATAAKLVFAASPANTTAGKALAPVKIDIEDKYGNIVTTSTAKITAALASGAGTLTGTLAVAAKAGVATFSNLLLTKAGKYTLKVTGTSLTAATSSSFTVLPAAATKMILTNEPGTTVAGKAISPALVIDLEDKYGNVATNNTTSVVVTAAGGGKLTGTTTVAVKSGVATLSNLLLDTAGKYTLKIADGTLPALTTGSFMVTPAAAAKLVITAAPTTGAVGIALTPALNVSVEDAFGNVVTTDKSTVTVAIHTGPSGGMLSGTDTASASMGIASFSNLKLSKAGAYTFEVTDGKLTDAVSASISVV